MKQKFSTLLLYSILTSVLLSVFFGCYKDKGNYVYKTPVVPVVKNLDSIYSVFVGDSLVIQPEITIVDKKARLTYYWTIHVPPVNPGDTDLVFTGRELHTVFGLGPKVFTARFTITNQTNGMKYFHDFIISGKTAFSSGTTVLSSEAGITRLSFIKPNDSVQPRIYQAVNPGEELPGNPFRILAIPVAYRPPIASYWVFGKSGTHTGVQIDANTFKRIKYLKDNFFDPPDTGLVPQKMFVNPLGVISGVINGKLYNGTTSTWNEAPTYGMFGLGATGDYQLSSQMVFNYIGTFGPGNYIGFDINRKQLLRFNLYGNATYFGANYNVIGDAFDPKHVGLRLIHLQQINGGLCYAYAMDGSNALYELKFNARFNGPFQIEALQKRLFARPELLSDSTLWQATANEIIYFTYKDKIYRYNPVNEDFRVLNADFGGRKVTMIRLKDESTLVAGVKGSLYFLNIHTGSYGTVIKRIDGIPGKVIDVAFRTQ